MVDSISIDQIRAARALLGWSQKALGEKSGFSQTAITNIESGRKRPSSQTIAEFKKTFERAGLEFIEGGVRYQPETVEVIHGPDFATRIMDFIYETLIETNAEEQLLTGYDPVQLQPEDEIVQDIRNHVQRLIQAGKSERILIREESDPAHIKKIDPNAPLHWYRAVPEEVFYAQTYTYIFADYFAMAMPHKQMVIILHNTDLAEDQRRKFNYLWKYGARIDAGDN